MPASTKDARLNLRLTSSDDELIRQAAAHTGQSVSEFLTTSAVERAHEILASQRSFMLVDATWERFVAMLEAPVRPDPRLVELFDRPTRLAP